MGRPQFHWAKLDVDVSRRGTTVKVNACVPDEDGGPALTALTVKLKVLFRGSSTEAAEESKPDGLR